MMEGRTQWPLFRARENQQSTSYNLSFFPILRSILSSTQCYKGVKIIRLLSLLIRSHFISIRAIWAVVI